MTSGATEALGSAILATVQPGDEVIIFTPAYDSYAPMIRRAGAKPVEIALQPPEWRVEREAIERALTAKTRAILFNNPQNPTGGLFDAEELEAVASVARERDLMVIGDEVWEHIVLDGRRFTPIATLPGMAVRTIKVGSAGKIFSLTGWKVGWIVAAPELAAVVARAHQFLTFSTAPNLQAAVAFGLDEGDAWLQPMRDRFQRSRDLMTAGLRGAGFTVLDAAATYFLCVDLESVGNRRRRRSLRRDSGRASRASPSCRSRPLPRRTRRGISYGCASARRTRRSRRAWRQWRRRGSCSREARGRCRAAARAVRDRSCRADGQPLAHRRRRHRQGDERGS